MSALLALVPGVGPAISFLRSPLGMIVIGAVAALLYTGFIWTKATDAANDRWKVKLAVATEQTRERAAKRAQRVQDALRVQVNAQTLARAAAEKQSQELRDAMLADKSDTTVRVSPELDRVFRNTLYNGGGD